MSHKHCIKIIVWSTGVLFFCASIIASTAVAATVTNNVSVESSSDNGTNNSSSISVKTVVDGQVVEDYQETSATGKLFYSSEINEDDFVRIIVASTSNSNKEAEIARLVELMSLLEDLLRLLTKISGST